MQPQPDVATAEVNPPPLADSVIVLGVVLAPHGIRGWVKVRTHTEDPAAILDYGPWWLRPGRGGNWVERALEAGRVQGGQLVAKLAGVDDREAALALRGCEVGVPRRALPPAAPGEIYWADLVGMRVVNRAGAMLGEVVGVVEHGAHPLLRVGRRDGATKSERLIPYVPAIVTGIDVSASRIEVDWGEDY